VPHFQIDYSANLEDVVDMGALCEAIRAAAAEIETFPTAGIRVRAIKVDHVAIADGHDKHGFIDVLKDFVSPAMDARSIALSAEMRDIDAALSPKFGNIRDHIEDVS